MRFTSTQKERGVTIGRILPSAGMACALIALTLAIGGCTGKGSTSGRHTGAWQLTPIGVEATYSFMSATGTQLTEGNAFFTNMSQLEELLTARCMTTLGFGPSDEPLIQFNEKYRTVAGGPVAPGFEGLDSGAIPDLYNMKLLSEPGNTMMPVSLGVSLPAKMPPPATQRAITAEFYRCQQKAGAPFAQLNRQGNALNMLWLREVLSIQASAQVQVLARIFGTCVRRNGAPAAAASSVGAYSRWVYLVSRPRAYAYGKPAVIKASVAVDRHWTKVFVTCGSALEALTQRLQLQAQRAFFQAHFQQVHALEILAAKAVGLVNRSISKSTP